MKPYSTFLAFSLVCLSCFGQKEPIRLSEQQKDLVRQAYEAIHEDISTASMSEFNIQRSNVTHYLEQASFFSSLLKEIASNPETLELILRIRDGSYTEEGQFFRNMWLAAANDDSELDSLLQGLKFEKGLISWPGTGLLLEGIFFKTPFYKFISVSDKVVFGGTQLKKDMDVLEAKLLALGAPGLNYSELETKDLKFWVKLFQKLNSRLPELISLPCELYTGMSPHDVGTEELKIIFEKLSLFLNDMTQNAKPRQ